MTEKNETNTTLAPSPFPASSGLGRIVMISLAILSLGLAIAWMGFFLMQY